jgi:hypothetical protein
MANKGKEKRGRRLIGCLGLVFIIVIAFGVFNMLTCLPQTWGDRDKAVIDIYRYQTRYGSLPESLEDLKSKLPDYRFKYRYFYIHNDKIFVVGYQGSGMMCDYDDGDFYRSDTKEWKDIQANQKELDDFESKLKSSK